MDVILQNSSNLIEQSIPTAGRDESEFKYGIPQKTIDSLKSFMTSEPCAKDMTRLVCTCMLADCLLKKMDDEQTLADFQSIQSYLKNTFKLAKKDWPKPLSDKLDTLGRTVSKAGVGLCDILPGEFQWFDVCKFAIELDAAKPSRKARLQFRVLDLKQHYLHNYNYNYY